MPRTARTVAAGICYHVINRGNARATVFHDGRDFDEFHALIIEATRRVTLDVLAYCLMPNHFHVVLRPHTDDGIARWTHWLTTMHAHRHRRRYGSVGHIWQGRFKAFPIQTDGHLLAVLRYVERNALRAGMVTRAEVWPWGSLAARVACRRGALTGRLPIRLPADWAARVNTPESVTELDEIRRCVRRDTPYGEQQWTLTTARALGLEYSLRPRGRPPGARQAAPAHNAATEGATVGHD